MGIAVFVLLVVIAVVQWRGSLRAQSGAANHPPQGRIVDIDGVPVHVWIAGTGPDLVLIHGASGNLRDFTFDLAGRLTDRYRVIAFDRPGLGWTGLPAAYDTSWSAKGMPPGAQAALLQKAADAVGVTNPIVLGHSYGGAVALAWGLARPDETAALVLLSSVSNPWPGTLGALYQITGSALGGALVVPLISAFTPQSVVETSVREIFAPQSAPDGYAGFIGADLILRPRSFRANARQVNSLRPHIVAMSQEYARLKMPVEVLHGTADTIVPLSIHAQPLARKLPDAVLTQLEGIGHMPQHAVPAEVVEAIDRAASRAGLR